MMELEINKVVAGNDHYDIVIDEMQRAGRHLHVYCSIRFKFPVVISREVIQRVDGKVLKK